MDWVTAPINFFDIWTGGIAPVSKGCGFNHFKQLRPSSRLIRLNIFLVMAPSKKNAVKKTGKALREARQRKKGGDGGVGMLE